MTDTLLVILIALNIAGIVIISVGLTEIRDAIIKAGQ